MPKTQSKGVALSREQRAERTRRRLLDACVQIVHTGGVKAVTTVRIAEAAGVHQTHLYAHFKNVDDCLAAAAAEVSERVGRVYALIGRDAILTRPDEATLAHAYATMFRSSLAERQFAEIYVAHRLDASALGRALEPVAEKVRADVVDAYRTSYQQVARASGAKTVRLRSREDRELRLLGDLTIGETLAGLEALLSGRAEDIDELSLMIARSAVTRASGVYQRLLRERAG